MDLRKAELGCRDISEEAIVLGQVRNWLGELGQVRVKDDT